MSKPNRKTNRAPQGAGGVCKRGDGRWQGTCTVGTNPATGKPMKKYVYAATEKECVKKLKALQAAIDNGTFVEPSRMTVAQWLDVWAAEYLGDVKGSTVTAYTVHIRNHIKPALGAVKLQALRPYDVQTFYNTVQREKGLAPKTIKNMHGAFHSALKRAVLNGYIRTNPADNAALPRAERPEIQTMPHEVIPAFIKAIQGHAFEAIYFTTLFTGIRKGEVLGLTWGCVDFAAGTIHIKQQLTQSKGAHGAYIFQSPKNGKPRKITPAPAVMEQLQTRQLQQKNDQERAGALWHNPDNLVFTNTTGGHLCPQTVYKHFKRIVTDIGCPALRFHDLRHTYAVNALQAGDNIKDVQDALGHHTAAFTLDVYGHVTEHMRQASANRMQNLIESMTQ